MITHTIWLSEFDNIKQFSLNLLYNRNRMIVNDLLCPFIFVDENPQAHHRLALSIWDRKEDHFDQHWARSRGWGHHCQLVSANRTVNQHAEEFKHLNKNKQTFHKLVVQFIALCELISLYILKGTGERECMYVCSASLWSSNSRAPVHRLFSQSQRTERCCYC